ncbi:MAG: hypothetical protein ACYCW6_17815 [Candidatus Xenobia bacterium]
MKRVTKTENNGAAEPACQAVQVHELERRLAALEAMLAGGVLNVRELNATEINVLDAAGRRRIGLMVCERSGTASILLNRRSDEDAVLAIDVDGDGRPSVELMHDNHRAVRVEVDKHGDGFLRLADRNGDQMAVLNGLDGLQLRGSITARGLVVMNGDASVDIGQRPGGEGPWIGMTYGDGETQQQLQLSVSPAGHPLLEMKAGGRLDVALGVGYCDPNGSSESSRGEHAGLSISQDGNIRAYLNVIQTSAGPVHTSLDLTNEEGSVVAELCAVEDGPKLKLFDRKGVSRTSLSVEQLEDGESACLDFVDKDNRLQLLLEPSGVDAFHDFELNVQERLSVQAAGLDVKTILTPKRQALRRRR